jgi:hypothetical protein
MGTTEMDMWENKKNPPSSRESPMGWVWLIQIGLAAGPITSNDRVLIALSMRSH